MFLDPLYVLRSELKREDVVLCHDLGPLAHSSVYDPTTAGLYATAYKRIARTRVGIVFVGVSRRDFVAHVRGNFRFLTMIPLYVRRSIELGAEAAGADLPKPFLPTISASEARKNYPSVIAGFHRSGLIERGYSYVLCGPRDNAADEVESLVAAVPRFVRPVTGPTPSCAGFIATLSASSCRACWKVSGLRASRRRCTGSPRLSAPEPRKRRPAGAPRCRPTLIPSPRSPLGCKSSWTCRTIGRRAKLNVTQRRAYELTLEAHVWHWANPVDAP
jgi:hypothetical protein